MVENSVIQLALYERLRQFNNVDWFCPAALDQLDLSRAKLVLEDGRALRYRLIVGADGARSKVRDLAGIECDSLEYKQHALIANIKTRLPQQDITWQCHARTGPQAFLPLTENRASIVWYHSPEQVQRLLALSEDEFADELGRAFPSRLGGIESIDGRGSFPLCRRHARRYVLPGLALIGDAAHIIHPHIGQGVNLGLLDAAALAEVMLGARVASRNPANLPVLRRYERWRRGYNLAFMGFSEIVYHAFAQQHLPLRMVRSGLFTIADQIGPINRLCMRYAMGLLGDLPRLAQGKPPLQHAAQRLSSNVVYSRRQPR
jgi:2-octaprenyl-3-methyl-6-methoxy-1,4-benzoquinol hydroxylase